MAQNNKIKISPVRSRCRTAWRGILLLTADYATAAGVSFLLLLLKEECAHGTEYLLCLMPAGLLVVFNWVARLYCGSIVHPGLGVGAVKELERLTINSFGAYLLCGGVLLHDFYSVCMLWIFCSAMITALLLPVSRYVIRRLMWHFRLGRIPVLIAGGGEHGVQLVAELARNRFVGFDVMGVADDDPAAAVPGVPYIGGLEQIPEAAKRLGVSYLICILNDWKNIPPVQQWWSVFEYVLMLSTNRALPIQWVYPAAITNFSGLEIGNRMLRRSYQLCKRFFEHVAVIVALPLALPVMLVLAAAIKISSRGPVLYSAERLGQNGKPFRIWKFRTMYHEADQRLEQMLAENPEQLKEWEQKFKLQNDPRVTPLGRFLRRTSLDELPQIWNVLRGEMALIGPRPIVEMELKYYGEHWDLVSLVKPGVTGLWQVSGRSNLNYAQRVTLDLYYLNNWSVWLDYYIFLKTIWVVLRCYGAR